MVRAAVLMYSRPRCHLCDDAREVILSLRGSFDFIFEEVDIESDDELVREYGVRIPVVIVDGEEVAEYKVDREELAGALER